MIGACPHCRWQRLVGTRDHSTVPAPVPGAPAGVLVLDVAGRELGWWPYVPEAGCGCG